MTWRLTIETPPVDTPRVLFDLTRLIRSRRRAAGTGVDRIDLALARGLAARHGADCIFLAAGLAGPAIIPRGIAEDLMASLERRWQGRATPARGLGPALSVAMAAGGAPWRISTIGEDATYVNGSHSGLPRSPGALTRIDRTRTMRRLIYLHDLIPMDFPEYQTPSTTARFDIFLREALGRPAHVLANTASTARDIARQAANSTWSIERISVLTPRLERVAPPPSGVALRPAVRSVVEGNRPWFVVVGTIEPRKNHLLLLHLWREMAMDDPALLVIIGRRGWENEMVLDILDRCATLKPHVVEFGDLDDGEVMALVAGARALLMPSFAEGLGVPLLEAGALQVPALAANLPALREIASPGTTFLDPLDGASWRREIRALSWTAQDARDAR